MTELKEHHPVEPGKVKVGDLMAFTTWARVERIAPGGNRLEIRDLDRSFAIVVDGSDLVRAACSADQHAVEKPVTRTQAAEILISSHNRPLTVVFLKSDGSLRTLRGRLVKHEALLGRSMVEDLDIADTKNRLRQVDHRTIAWLICDGIKYTVK